MTFDEWYSQTEWWKDNEDSLREAWVWIAEDGIGGDTIAIIFDKICGAVRDEYGE